MTARSPAASIIYSLWLRSRLVIALSLLTTFALCGIAPLLGPVPRVVIGMGAGIAFMSGLALLMGVVTYGGADLSTPESVYPKHPLVFPASTRTLVAVPMLYGTLSVAAYWLLVSGAAMAPVGFKLPVLWPAGMMAAMVAWLQAASWSPYKLPFLRIALVLLVLLVLVSIGAAGQVYSIQPALAAALSVLIGAAAFPVAVTGVARARRGDGVGASASKPDSRSASSRPIPSRFKSGMASQFWFDRVRNLWYAPAVTALVELIFFLVFIANRHPHPNVFLPSWVPSGLGPLSILCAVPMFVVMIHAIVLGKFDMWTKPLDFPAFFLTRPISTAAIVAGKLRSAAVVTALVWLAPGLVIAAFVCVPRTYDGRQSWAAMIANNATWQVAAAIALAVFLLLLFTWSQIARSLWIGVSGSKWLVHGFPTAGMLAWGALGWIGYRLYDHPRLWHSVLNHAGGVLAAAATVRLLIAVALLGYLVRRNLLRPAAALASLAVWLLTCGILCAAVLMLAEPLRHAPALPVAIIAIFVPLVRPALAVLFLHHGRHR